MLEGSIAEPNKVIQRPFMFRTDVVDIINSGDAWLFVGSGVSKDAGLPSWEELVTRTVSSFHLDLSDAITEDSRFIK